jgi:hypothetical protein
VNLLYPISFTDATPLPAGNYNFNQFEFMYTSDLRKTLGMFGMFTIGQFYNGNVTGGSLGISWRSQPHLNISVRAEINKIELLNDVKTTAFNSIRLKVSLEEVNENLIGKLDRLINENAGKSNLEFFIEDEVNKQKVKLFSKKNKVEINDNFLLELDKLITINYDLT